MPNSVLRYVINGLGKHQLEMPEGAKAVDFGEGGCVSPVLTVIADKAKPFVQRKFMVIKNSRREEELPDNAVYIGAFYAQWAGQWYCFELKDSAQPRAYMSNIKE